MLHACISKGITYQILKMHRMTMLLVYAALLAAFGHANPYSRISNPPSDIYDQYSDKSLGVNNAAAEAQLHSSASSSSYSGYTSAAAAASSSSFSANNVNIHPGYAHADDIKSQIANVEKQRIAQSAQSAQVDRENRKNYWWMNANSPFELNVQQSGGCNSNQCGGGNSGSGASVDNNNNKDNSNDRDDSAQNNLNIQGNPFLQGTVNIVSTSTHKPHDISKNPFFNGVSSSASTSTKVNSVPNQFQHNYNTNIHEIGQTSERVHNNGYFEHSIHQDNGEGGLSVSCSGHGKICISKHLCINGYVSSSVQGLTQIKSDDQQCKIDSEVCCTLGNIVLASAVDQESAGTHESASHFTNQVNRHESSDVFHSQSHYQSSDASSHANGGIFGHYNKQQHEIDLNAGDQTQQHIDIDDNSNGYLPPIGSEPSSNIPAFSKPPQPQVEHDHVPSSSGPAPTHIQLGCAAALICVEEQFCGMDGMINPTSLSLTSEQLIRRMPLSDCKNPDSGIIGKCCRDPNYVDPWPTGNLPANYTGGFDEQGFPTFLNIQRTRPTKKPTGSPVKGGLSHFKAPVQQPVFSSSTFPPQLANIPNTPTQIGQGSVNILTGQPSRPIETIVPPIFDKRDHAPTDNILVSSKPFPNLPNSFAKNKYDGSPSNTNPIVIPPDVSEVQCGVKNSVQRPSGLSDVDVGFGEIPWEAMILLNREKKLLCSGAIIGPNLIMTAGNCVYGLRADEISIKAGEWKLGYELKHEEPLPFEIFQVSSIILYPGYEPGRFVFDMAILMLNHSLTYNKHISPICLSEDYTEQISRLPSAVGKKCISTGWGKHVLQSHLAGAIMHSIEVNTLSIQECQQRLLNAESQIEINDGLVCGYAKRQNNNMCQVDLGGPLACDRGDGIYDLVGIYNQDTGCLPTNQVATFTLVDVNWVHRVWRNPFDVSLKWKGPLEAATINVPEIRSRKDEPCDCQKSVLPPENNQYLPPV